MRNIIAICLIIIINSMNMFASFYRLPVDSKTLFGYAFAFCVELSGSFFTSHIVIPYLCLAIATLWVIKSFVKDITNDLPMLNVTKASDANYKMVTENFCAIAQRLSDAKQLS